VVFWPSKGLQTILIQSLMYDGNVVTYGRPFVVMSVGLPVKSESYRLITPVSEQGHIAHT